MSVTVAALHTHLHKALTKHSERTAAHLADVRRRHATRAAAAAAAAASAAAAKIPASGTTPAPPGGKT